MLGILGRKGSGKDLIADYISLHHNYQKISFAMPLKHGAQHLFGLTHSQVNENFKDVIDIRYNKTPRELLQWLGTDVFRKQLQDDFWIKRAMHDINLPVVISDVRFQNEVDEIRRRNGIIIKVVRPGIPLDEKENNIDVVRNVDFILLNNSSVESLYRRLDIIMYCISRGNT